MNKIKLTPDQIIELIFDKKLVIGDTVFVMQGSGMELLSSIEERIIYGKCKSKNIELCEFAEHDHSKYRKQFVS